MNVAIIGANGFIGKHLTERLLKEKDIHLFLYGRSRHESLIQGVFPRVINFHDNESLRKEFAEIDLVYYLVSETIPVTSWHDPAIEVEKNLKPFIGFMEVISKLKVKKVAYISSAGTVYGTTTGSVAEDSDKRPFSPYGIIKLAMENFLHYYNKKYDIRYDVYRVSNVYGEGQNTSKGLGIINTFLEKIIREKKVEIFGNGDTIRNYIYVKDVAELFCLSIRTMDTSDIYNVSSDNTLSINELLGLMRQIVTEDFEVLYLEGRQSDNPYIDLVNTKILNCSPGFKFTGIREGISQTYSFLKKPL